MHSLNLHLISLMLFLLINRFIPIESSSRIIVVNNHNNKAALGSSSSSSSGSGNKVIHNDLIAKIISETTANRQNGFGSGGGGEERTSLGNSDKSLKTTTNIMNSLSGVGSNDVYTFMDKLADLGVRTRCDASMLRSDVQNRVRQLKSIVSSCPVYCRVAVNSRSGFVYGAREFNLETLWERVDVDDASLIKNNALLGAYFIKFVSSKRYLCITKYGKLFTSVNKSNDCLWFNDEPKLTSAVHKNVDLLIDKNCHLDAETNRPRQYKRRRSTNNINNNNNNNDRDTCESNVKITSGPSPNLKKFFHTCQSTLLGTNNQPQPQHPPAQVHHTHYPKPSTKTNKMAKERVELFCANYLLDEIEFADEVNRSNPKSQSHRIPDICIEYLVKYQNKSMPVLQTTTPTPTMSVANMSKLELAALLNKAALKPKQKPHQHQQQHYQQQQQQQQEHQLPSIEHELNLDENYHNNVLLPSDGDPSSSSSSNNKVDTNMRKCYLLRSTSLYQKCMEKHYKCYRFNNNPENLRKCRKKYGVTPAPRKKIIIH